MPIKHAIWKVGSKPTPLPTCTLVSEQQLEDMIVATPDILSSEWMLIGRQEPTGLGGRIDLLAIAPDASLVVIEIKRHRTPRDVVAQAIDYASWVENLTATDISQVYERFSEGGDLAAAFKERFGVGLQEEELNQSHQVVIVAAELDDSTQRITQYLSKRDIAVNAVCFQVFKHGSEKLISRAWLVDPGETQANVAATARDNGATEPWNGEYYVSFGSYTTWEDARKYGFISAGGGRWYSQTLEQLEPGDRVWVNIPGTGYVGVGKVTERVQPIADFKIRGKPAVKVLDNASELRKRVKDPDTAEYFVRVDWLETRPENEAVREVGFFGNQNTVCAPKAASWRHTVERLRTYFKKWDQK